MAYVSYFVSKKNKLTEVLKDTDNRVMALKLTLKNADADQVSAVLALLTESYRRFTKLSGLDKYLVGDIKTLQHSFNGKDYHIFIESLLVLKKAFFDKISYEDRKATFPLYWRDAMRVTYVPYVYFSAPKRNQGQNYLQDSVSYLEDLLSRMDHNVDVADQVQQVAIKGRPMISFGGCFK